MPQRIVNVREIRELKRIRDAATAAVICTAPVLRWMKALEDAVQGGAYHTGRMFLPYLAPSLIRKELDGRLPHDGIAAAVRTALVEDLMRLVDVSRSLTRAASYQVRCITDTPNRRYGFHVDLGRHVPTRRVLRVYAGPGAEYVDFADVVSMAELYRHIGEREELSARIARGAPNAASLTRRVAALDAAPSFLRPGAPVRHVPRGAIVAVECVPESRLWSDDIAGGRADGWIHRSPFDGAPRLFAAVTSGPA